MIGMIALHFLDQLPSIPEELFRLPLEFAVGEVELYRLMVCVSFMSDADLARWPSDATLGTVFDWHPEPGAPTKFVLENFMQFLARFSDLSKAPARYPVLGVPRCLYAVRS